MFHRSLPNSLGTSQPRAAAGAIWFIVATLAFLNPLFCLIHCAEDPAGASLGEGQQRALMICQLALAGLQSPFDGVHGSATSQPKLPAALLRAFYDLLPLSRPVGLLPILLVALHRWRDAQARVRASDAPPTPPPRPLASALSNRLSI